MSVYVDGPADRFEFAGVAPIVRWALGIGPASSVPITARDDRPQSAHRANSAAFDPSSSWLLPSLISLSFLLPGSGPTVTRRGITRQASVDTPVSSPALRPRVSSTDRRTNEPFVPAFLNFLFASLMRSGVVYSACPPSFSLTHSAVLPLSETRHVSPSGSDWVV